MIYKSTEETTISNEIKTMQRTEKFGQNMMRGKEKEKRGKEEREEERKKNKIEERKPDRIRTRICTVIVILPFN